MVSEHPVTVTVPARLHLGFLDLHGGLGRRFGGIGLAIDTFRTRIRMRRATAMRVTGAERERLAAHVETMRQALQRDDAYHVEVLENVPAHAGFGSGTQLALAVAACMRRLHDMPPDIASDAITLGRGTRSGLGVGLFQQGGLAVDGGRGTSERPAPIVSRLPFPDAWRVLVVLDPARQGAHGTDELAAFGALGAFPERDAAHLCRLVLMKALPALAEHDIARFGAAIGELQARLGDHFAAAQDGARFTSPAVAAALAAMERAGAQGIGQSSWGPTGFCFAPSQAEAERLAAAAGAQAAGLNIRICCGLNRGAEIAAPAVAHSPGQS
jgi:beta-RFAP synthase